MLVYVGSAGETEVEYVIGQYIGLIRKSEKTGVSWVPLFISYV